MLKTQISPWTDNHKYRKTVATEKKYSLKHGFEVSKH